ncbi:hypothetical protein B0H10DRAFT_2245295 [Mycena sp. CBHHK59/15]|nr:hypothetical protein B0H10DRAFT_2245295 [Mycena sp. CBHHK59/15]
MLPTTTRHDSPHAKREPPPDPVMMLLSATNIHLASLPTLTVHEDLHITSKRAVSVVKITAKVEEVPVLVAPIGGSGVLAPSGPSAAPQTAAPPMVPTPTPAPQTTANRRPTPFGSGGDSDSDSYNGNTPKVARPTGLTRQALERHRDWGMDQATTDAIRAYAHKLADEQLDKSLALTYQEKKQVKHVTVQFPDLRRFSRNWPTECILQAHLKVTSSAATKAAMANQASALAQLAQGSGRRTRMAKTKD